MNLYELTQDLKELDLILNSEEDIPEEELNEARKIIMELISNKGEGITYIVRNTDSDIDNCKAEIKRLQDRVKQHERKIERLRGMLKDAFLETGIKKLDTSLGRIGIRKTAGRIEIIDAELLEDYKQEKITYTYDKNRIKNDIKSGKEVKGAELIIEQVITLPKIKKD